MKIIIWNYQKAMDELMEVCQKLKDAGITPISVGSTDKLAVTSLPWTISF